MILNNFLSHKPILFKSGRLISVLGCLLLSLSFSEVLACTSGLFGASVTRDGRPLLWKHRDTSAVDNKVEYIPAEEGSFAYVALFNASDRDCKEAWTGFNTAGFAIMNTASYNIKDDKVPEKDMDKEGLVMTLALRHCATVDDFAMLLDSLPRPMGVEANFGVFDASGNGAFFETNNHSYIRYDLKDQDQQALVRTNYSHSGRENEGFGFIREKNALHLLEPVLEANDLSPEYLTETVSRSFYHSLHDRDFLQDQCDGWAIDQDFIPRYKSSAVIVIEGIRAGEASQNPGELYVMWTGLGYPPCSEIYPVECRPEGVDSSLRGLAANGHSEMSDRAKRRRDMVFPRKYDNGDRYIKLNTLSNPEGTGFLQTLVPQNLEVYEKYRRKRNKGE